MDFIKPKGTSNDVAGFASITATARKRALRVDPHRSAMSRRGRTPRHDSPVLPQPPTNARSAVWPGGSPNMVQATKARRFGKS
jgi:hypothetical protein